MSGPARTSSGTVGAGASLAAFVLLAGMVTYVLLVVTGWTNEECAPGAFACDAAAVLGVRLLIGGGFVVGVVLGVVGCVRAARRGRGLVCALLAWPVWLVGVGVGDLIASS